MPILNQTGAFLQLSAKRQMAKSLRLALTTKMALGGLYPELYNLNYASFDVCLKKPSRRSSMPARRRDVWRTLREAWIAAQPEGI